MAEPAPGRRTFGPVVLVGLLASGALATAATQPWFAFDSSDPAYTCQAPCVGYSFEDTATVSAANALALVTLACWGVVLVTRGRFRQIVSAVGLLGAVGALVAVVTAFPRVPDDLRELAAQYGSAPPEVGTTGWLWIGVAASIIAVLAWVAAVRFVRSWPEMGRRYDAPSDDPPEDLWKALDAGHDPTS